MVRERLFPQLGRLTGFFGVRMKIKYIKIQGQRDHQYLHRSSLYL